MPIRICCVCAGNICRSPIAEIILRERASSRGIDAIVESRGTGAWHSGEDADPRTHAALARAGYQLLGHRAQAFRADDFTRFDLVLAMDRENFTDLEQLAVRAGARPTLRLFLQENERTPNNMPDPYFGSDSDFDEVVRLAELASDRILAEALNLRSSMKQEESGSSWPL
ncbi:MAG: low molecular weight protein-tyrosine-phosphatase [Acidimicrobiales bacterium]